MKSCVIVSIYKYDKLQYVQEMLESLYAQSYKADIFIKIDGGIHSELEKYLFEEYAKKNITYLSKRESNKGLAVSLNELIIEVMNYGYEYIYRMDADDIALPHRFEKQYCFMQNNNDIDVVGSFIEEFDIETEYRKIIRYPLTHEEMFRFFKKRVPLAHVTAMFRRSFFEKAGLYPTSSPTNEDTLLWMKGFAAGCRFANLPDVLVKVRVSKGFFSRRGGARKAWSDFKDRLEVIRTLGYNWDAYFYAVAMLGVNLAPGFVKKILYKKLR